MREKLLWGVIAVLSIALIVTFFFKGDYGKDIARIENRTISYQEFVDEMIKRYGAQLLTETIEREAVYFEANRMAVEVNDREIDKEIEKYRHNFIDDGRDFEAVLLNDYGITLEQLREDVKYNLLLEKLATIDVRISDTEMERYYEENQQFFKEPEKIRIRRILMSDLEEINKAYNELREGASFAGLAMELSQDRLTAANGGDLGYINVDSIFVDYEILDVAMRLEPGQYSQPFESYDGWNIILVEDRVEESIYEYSEVKSMIFRELALRQAKPLNEYLQDLIIKLDIEIYEQNIKKYLQHMQ